MKAYYIGFAFGFYSRPNIYVDDRRCTTLYCNSGSIAASVHDLDSQITLRDGIACENKMMSK